MSVCLCVCVCVCVWVGVCVRTRLCSFFYILSYDLLFMSSFVCVCLWKCVLFLLTFLVQASQ